jgi:hypothetical protein
LCEDLQYQSREKAFIDFLQTSELYYFTQPTEYYTFTLTLENPLFHNTEDQFADLLKMLWPIPKPFSFSYEKLFEPLLLFKKNCPNQQFFIDYLKGLDECTLLTILYNYQRLDLGAKINSSHACSEINLKSKTNQKNLLQATITLHLINRIRQKNEFYSIMRQCKLTAQEYWKTGNKISIRYSKETQTVNKIKKLLAKNYPLFILDDWQIKSSVKKIMKDFTSFIPKIEIENNDIDLSNLDLDYGILSRLYYQDERLDHYDPYRSLININLDKYDNDSIKKTKTFPGAFSCGNQSYSYGNYIMFKKITKLSFAQNPLLTKIPFHQLVHCFLELKELVLDAKNIKIIMQNMTKDDYCALAGLRRWHHDSNVRIFMIPSPLKITLFDENKESPRELENLYTCAYKHYFFKDDSLIEIYEKQFYFFMCLILINAIISFLMEETFKNFFNKGTTLGLISSACMIFLLSFKTIDKYDSKKIDSNAHFITFYWICTKLFLIFASYMTALYYTKKIHLVDKNFFDPHLLLIGINLGSTMYGMYNSFVFDKWILRLTKNLIST